MAQDTIMDPRQHISEEILAHNVSYFFDKFNLLLCDNLFFKKSLLMLCKIVYCWG